MVFPGTYIFTTHTMKALLWIVAIVIVVGGAWYLLVQTPSGTPTPTATSNEPATSSSAAATVPKISYTDTGFSPSSLTVPVGTTVTFADTASDAMYIASSPHPTHQDYDGTTRAVHCAAGYTGATPFDECTAAKPGQSWTFTFTKPGTWKFHNHANPTEFGSVTVQ